MSSNLQTASDAAGRHRVVGRLAAGAAAATLLMAFASSAVRADDTFDINVILPLSGPASFVGQSSQDTLRLVEKVVNKEGGIDGKPIRFVVEDDRTSPQTAVQLTNGILASPPPVLMGSGSFPMCAAMAPLVAKGPVTWCFSPGMKPPAGGYMFASGVESGTLVKSLLRYFKSQNLKKIALILTSDANGQDGERAFDAAVQDPDLSDVTLVTKAHFNPADLNVSAQVEQVRAANPDAVVAWATGSPIGTVFRSLNQAGVDLPTGTLVGNLSYRFMSQYGSVLPSHIYFAGTAGSAVGGGLNLDPAVAEAKKQLDAAYEGTGLRPDNGTEMVWDPAMIIVGALKQLGGKADPDKVKDYLSQLKYSGASGIYDFTKVPQRGLGADNVVIMTWDKDSKVFVPVTQPGGASISK